MIELAIRKILLDDTAVAELSGGRVIVDRLPQGDETPAVVLWVESERALDALDGPLGMDQPKLRVVCYSQTRVGASNLRMAVRTVLAGFSGVVIGLYIKGLHQEPARGQQMGTDRQRTGTDAYRYLTTQDFRVSYDAKVIQ